MGKSFICLDVINTMWYDYRGTGKSEDRLENDKWLKLFINDWEVSHLPYPTARNIKSLQQLRQLMRNIFKKTSENREPSSQEIQTINDFMSKTKRKPTLIKKAESYELISKPLEDSWEAFISEVALSFSNMFITNEYKRVKICKNQDCLWVFYDDTKNGRKHWCSSEACGNLSRVRKHRENR